MNINFVTVIIRVINNPYLNTIFENEGKLQGAAYVFERFLDGCCSQMAKAMSMKFFTTIIYGV